MTMCLSKRRWFRFNLVIEMLFISGHNAKRLDALRVSFNLAIEMLFISGLDNLPAAWEWIKVSISQSRGFSFQDHIK